MTVLKKLVLMASAIVLPLAAPVVGQRAAMLDPAELKKPLKDSWPTYSGDYTGMRYSALTQVNQTTVKNLTLAWTARLNGADPTAAAGGGGRGFGGRGGFGGFGGGPTAPVITPVSSRIFRAKGT